MTGSTRRSHLSSYENRLLITLSLAEASMFIDRLALGFLSPFVVRDLALSNLQLGLLSSGFSLTYAVFGYVIGGLSDRAAKRRAFLIACTVAFSLLSACAGLAQTFIYLLIVRLLGAGRKSPPSWPCPRRMASFIAR